MLFTIHPAENCFVTSTSRGGFKVLNKATGVARIVGDTSCADARVLRAEPKQALSLKRVLADECDGRHACRYHGASCPEIVIRKRLVLARAKVQMDLLEKRASRKAAVRGQRVATNEELRALFEQRRNHFMMEFEGYAPHKFEYLVWGMLAQDVISAGLDLTLCGFLTHKERNKLMHAMNGNIMSGIANNKKLWYAKRDFKAVLLFCAGRPKQGAQMFTQLHPADQVVSDVEEQVRVTPVPPVEVANARTSFRDLIDTKYDAIKKKVESRHMLALDSEILADEVDLQHVASAFISAHPRFQQYAEVFGVDRMNELARLADLEARGAKRLVVSNRARVAKALKDGELPKTYGILRDSPAWLAPFGVSLIKFGELVDKALNDAGIDPITRPLPSNACGPMSSSSAASAAGNVVKGVGNHVRVKQAEGSQLMHNHHRLARNSSQSDIETNPGPSVSGIMTQLLNSAAGVLSIPFGDSHHLQFSVHANIQEADRMQRDVTTIGGVKILDEWKSVSLSDKAKTARRDVDALLRPCDCDAPDGAGLWLIEASLSKSLRKAKVPKDRFSIGHMGLLTAQLCRNHLDDIRAIIANGSNMIHVDQVDDDVLDDHELVAQVYQFEPCQVKEHTPAVMRAELFKLPSRVLGSQLDFETDLSDWGFGHVKCNICNAYEYGFVRNLPAEPLVTGHQLLPTFGKMFWQIIEAASSHSFSERCLWIYVPDGQLPDVSAVAQGFEIVFLIDSEFFEDTEIPDGTDKLELPNFLDNWDLLGVRMFANIAAPLSFNVVVASNTLFKLPTEISTIPIMSARLTGDVLGIGECSTLLLDECLFVGTYQQLFVLDELAEPLTFWRFQNEPSNMIICESPDISDAVSLVPSIANPRTAAHVEVAIMWVGSTRKCVYIPDATSINLSVAKSVLDPATSSLGGLSDALAFLRYPINEAHVGREFMITPDLLPWAPPRPIMCGCLFCNIRAHYGPIVFPIYGTTGDRNPIRAVARQLLKWGIDIIFLELQPLDVGIDDLERIHSGELLHLIPKYSGFKGLIASLPYITIGTPDLDAEISILLDPPPSALKEYDWRLGPILNPVISFLSGHMSTHPRIAAYPGWTHLPRSMDGHRFLEWSKVPREGRPDKVLWMIGSARVKIPVDAKQIIPGDHWPQLERAECVYTHGGAGSVQAAHCAGVSRIVVLDPMGDRGYKDLNNAGAGVSPGQDPDRALLLLLGHDFLPLILAYRSSFMLGLNALVWYFKLFAIPDLITVMTLFMISNEMGSFVLVPGSVVMTFVGSLAAMLFGRGVSIVLAIALQIWGMTLLRRLGVSPPAIAMKILRIGRLVGNSPYAALFWAAGYRRTAIVNLIIEKMGIPFYALCVKAYREPRGYIDFVYVAELSFLPMHTRFVSLDLKTVVEGGPLHDGPKGLYRLVRREYTTGDDDNLCIRFPILLDPLSINLQAQSIGEYILILHNCQTVMLASMDGAFMLMGPALLLMVPMFILAVVFGLTSLLTLGLFTLLIMVYLFTAGEDITPAMAFIKTVMNRYRALVLMARLKERESVWSQVLKSALAMAYSPGLTEEDRIAFDAAIRFNASVDAAIDTDHLLQTYATALQDLVNAIPGLADYAGSFGAFAGLSRLPIDLSVAAFVAQDMEEARNIDLLDRILNSAKVLAKVGVLEFENLKFEFEALDDLDAFIEARFQNPTLILLQDIFHAIAEHQVDTSFLVDFIELLPNVSNTFELLKELFASHTSATCNESSELVRQILSRCQTRSDIFIRPFILDDPIAQQIDVEYDAPLTQDEILRLAGQAAVGMAVGCDVHESIMQSIEMSADFLHDGSVPFCDAESAAYRDLSRYYETTRPIRDIFGSCLNGITWLRDYIVRKHHYTFSLMPLHAIFGFLGLLCSVSLAFGARVCIAAIVTCCQMIGIDERVIYDIGGQIAFFIQMLDPAHRANPKPVWALLWKRKRANVSKGEALLFSIMPSTFVKAESYSDWVDQMAHLLDGSDVDVTKLWRVPPERAVYYPDNTYGLSEYLELPISVQTHFKETARERKLLEDSIAAGNGLAIDGAWLARPEHVTASIERYTVERPVVSFGAKAAITAAADALFDHYKELYDMPKPMTVADVMKNSKWKYAAGLPFMPYIRKRQTLQQTSWYDAIARAATKILETGRMPAVGLHGFPKAQVVSAERLLKDPSAMRTVTAGDRITAIAVNTLLMERNKRVGNIDAGLLNMMRRSEGSIVQIGQDIRRFPNIYSGDATRFDSTVVAEVATVGSVRLYQRGIDSFGVYNSKAAVSVVHAYYEALTHGLIVNLIDGSVVWKTGGGGTGSAATTPDNRDWTRMVMIASWALTMGLPARDFFKHVKLTNASDDVFFSVDNQTDAKLQDWVNTMKTEYGVRFAFTREENLNNILHLVKVPEEEVDREIYSVLGVDPPVDSLRVSPKRMLLMRSAYRSDRMKLNNAVAATYLADRSTGYQLLSAHSPDIYNLVTQDLIDAQLAYMSEHFATATAMIGRSESGLINDYHIDLGTQRPARSLIKAAKRAARRNPGRPDYEAHYIAEAQRKAKIWLRQRRGKSYRDVMSLWIKTPPPPSDGRSGRRWQRINAVASAIGPLSDLVRLGVIKLSTISEIVPKALTSITPEIATLGVNRPFMTWDFTIEQYIWRREFVRIGKAPPISRLHELIRQSPYAAITDIAGFEALLRNETVLRALVAATTSNRSIRGSIWAVSNDAVTGRVICILALYTTIDLIIRFMEQKLIFGVFIMAAFGIFRLLDVFYSLQSLAFWVCTGMASLAISNTVPRDKYILQKKLSVILAALVPGFVTDYWFGVFAALPYLAKIIELQAIVPWLILAANTEMSQKVLQQGTGSFDLALEFWINNDFEMFLLGGVGSGKSTALPAALAHLYPRTQLVVLVPTNALVTNYVNDFLEDNRVLRVHREYPRDTKFVHNLVVMTYAQFWRRVGQLATSPIVLFDECHVASNDIFLAYQECKTMDVRRIYLTATFGGEFCAYLPHVVRYQQPDRVMPFIRSAPVIIPDTGNLNSDYVTAVRKAIADGAEPRSIMSYHPSIKTLRLWSTAFTGMGTPIRFITADHTDASSRSAVFVTGVVAMGANIRPPPKVLIYAPKILVPVHRYPTDDHGAITIRSGDLLNHISLVYVDMPAVDKHQLEGRVGREANGSIYIIGNAVGPPLPPRINLSELSMLQSDRVDALLLQVSKYPGFLVQQDSDVFLGFFLVDRQNEQLASLGCAFAALVLSLGTFPAVFDCIAFARHSTEHADALANSNFFLQQFGLSIPPVLNFWAGLAAFCQTCTLCLEHEQRSSAIPIFANNGIVIYDLSLIAQKLQVHERPFSARIALAGEVLSNLPKFALRDVSETLVSSITPAIYFDFDTPGVDQMITLLGGVAVITPIIIRLMQLQVRICEPRLIHFSCCPSELAMGNMYLCVGTYEQFFVVFDTDSNLLFISGLHHVRAQIHVSVATREVTMPLLLPHLCHQIFLDQEERSPPL